MEAELFNQKRKPVPTEAETGLVKGECINK
jgi:hypothetical protein